jgi:hypothetical protein
MLTDWSVTLVKLMPSGISEEMALASLSRLLPSSSPL